jgi:hypothetical protein
MATPYGKDLFTTKDTKSTKFGNLISEPFVLSIENRHVKMISRTKKPLSSVIPAEAGIQANLAENKPGFPPARE